MPSDASALVLQILAAAERSSGAAVHLRIVPDVQGLRVAVESTDASGGDYYLAAAASTLDACLRGLASAMATDEVAEGDAEDFAAYDRDRRADYARAVGSR